MMNWYVWKQYSMLIITRRTLSGSRTASFVSLYASQKSLTWFRRKIKRWLLLTPFLWTQLLFCLSFDPKQHKQRLNRYYHRHIDPVCTTFGKIPHIFPSAQLHILPKRQSHVCKLSFRFKITPRYIRSSTICTDYHFRFLMDRLFG